MHDNEKYQSAYNKFHSTETALVRVANDIVLYVNEKKAFLLVLIDLSAALDTVDHRMFLNHMLKRLAIHDTSLS